ncbi:MAG: hypothetical protein Q9Q40_14870 [Acidobacteriota bacterium]|nr:hypothetical protein [Acidobacteriota bacterium]MDQ7086880.1 hypothetical protein [Acidobacteriota bacterium]
MKKLNVQELESRIAPSVGLFGFLQSLAQSDAEFGEVFNQVVDADGNVDVGTTTDLVNNSDVGVTVNPVVSSFNISNLVIPDSTAQAILSMFGG